MFNLLTDLNVPPFAQAPDPLGDLTHVASRIPYGRWIAVGMFVLVAVYLIVIGSRGPGKKETPPDSRTGWIRIGLGIFFLIVAAVIALHSFFMAVIVI